MKTLITILFFTQAFFAQQVSTVAETVLIADTFVGIDSYNNTYFIKDRVLTKIGEKGIFNFNDYQLGRISSVDIVNPLKVVAYYGDTNTAVLLDNRLSEIERINFNNLPNFINTAFVTNAGNNRLWLFNVDSQQVELYNYRNNSKTIISQPITEKVLSVASNFNYFFVLTENRLLSYNIFGSILSEKEVAGLERIYQQNEAIYAIKKNELFRFLSEAGNDVNKISEIKKIALPQINLRDLYPTQDFLYIYDGKSIFTFKLNQSN